MAMRDKIEHAIQNQPCTVKDLKNKFGGDRGADRKVMEAVDQLVHEAVICQRQGVFFTVRSGRADKALLCKVVKLGKNFAFVMLEDGTSDIFIPGRFTRGAMPGHSCVAQDAACGLFVNVLTRLAQSRAHGGKLFRGSRNLHAKPLDVVLHIGIVLRIGLSIFGHLVGRFARTVCKAVHITHDRCHLCFQLHSLVCGFLNACGNSTRQRCAKCKTSFADHAQHICDRRCQGVYASHLSRQRTSQTLHLTYRFRQGWIHFAHDADAKI